MVLLASSPLWLIEVGTIERAGALDFLTAVSISAVTKRSHRDTDQWTCVSSVSKAKDVTVTTSPAFVMIILQHQAA